MEKYTYSSGFFLKCGTNTWEEWQNGQRLFSFEEYNRDQEWVYLHDASRSLSVSIPLAGGQCFLSVNRSDWSPLYEVRGQDATQGDGGTPLRQSIVNFALQAVRYQDQFKPEAEELAHYYVEAGIVEDENPEVLPAVKKAVTSGRPIRLWDRDSHWCGIFATCVLRRASVGVKWGPLPGSGGWGIVNVTPGEVAITWGNKGLQAGDVAVIPQFMHHFVVTEVEPSSGTVRSVDGNQENHTIKQRSDHRLSDINYYYKILR